MRSITSISLLFIVVISGCAVRQDKREQDTLLVWGQHDYDMPCSVWLVDPAQKISKKVLDEVHTCNFNIVNIDDTPHLIYRERPGEIIIYEINATDRMLNVQEVITLPDREIFSLPQWDSGRNIYFSSTAVEGVEQIYREQIYRVDKETKPATPFIRHDNGLATSPVISPDGRFLAYWTLDGPANRTSMPYCITGCGVGYYHVFDLDTGLDVPLLPMVKQIREASLAVSHHENALWSPTGQFLAFQLSVRGAGGIVIFDARNAEIVADLQSDQGGDTEIVQWVSGTELVYMAHHYLPELGYALGRPYIYSLESKVSRELLPDLPLTTEDGLPNIFYAFTVTSDGRHSIGVFPPASLAEGNEVSLLIADLSQDEPVYTFSIREMYPDASLQGSPFEEPTWAISGEWLAYYSEYLAPESDTPFYRANLHVINVAGETVPILGEGASEVLLPLQYAWIQSR